MFSNFYFFLLSIITKKTFPADFPIQVLPSVESKEAIQIYFSDILRYIIESITLTQAWDYHFLFLNGAAWSVSALLFFYITFYFFVKKLLKIENLELFLISIWIISLLPALYFTYTHNFASDIIGLMHRNPILRLPDFIAGMTFYLICLKTKNNSKNIQLYCFIFAIFCFFLMHYLVKNNPQQWFYLSHNGLFLFSQLALVYSFLNINIKNKNLAHYFERLGKASLSIYMLHLPLLAIYHLIYKLIVAATYSTSISETIKNAKDVTQLNIISVIIFMIILIPLSLFLQEKIFTPIQIKLSNKLIEYSNQSKERKTP
ncbi:acyltransferase family protein [Acinetobacter gerneri]|uniref:acyltransferase family protein n=1 Tax=Acinetobacter gerneri TaxID=202952 RepID=UPI0023F024B7|nr:acyltransferase family protein [Acinetobacter gerneri]MCH4244758.1 acyltransferase family protein [Acinetobacter gerneri]